MHLLLLLYNKVIDQGLIMIPLFFLCAIIAFMTVSTEMRLMIVKCRLRLTFIVQTKMHLMRISILFQVADNVFSKIGHHFKLRDISLILSEPISSYYLTL